MVQKTNSCLILCIKPPAHFSCLFQARPSNARDEGSVPEKLLVYHVGLQITRGTFQISFHVFVPTGASRRGNHWQTWSVPHNSRLCSRKAASSSYSGICKPLGKLPHQLLPPGWYYWHYFCSEWWLEGFTNFVENKTYLRGRTTFDFITCVRGTFSPCLAEKSVFSPSSV